MIGSQSAITGSALQDLGHQIAMAGEIFTCTEVDFWQRMCHQETTGSYIRVLKDSVVEGMPSMCAFTAYADHGEAADPKAGFPVQRSFFKNTIAHL